MVNLAAEKAHVRYVPGLANPDLLVETVTKTGFKASVSTQDTHAEEKARKLAVYQAEVRRFWISVVMSTRAADGSREMDGNQAENGGR